MNGKKVLKYIFNIKIERINVKMKKITPLLRDSLHRKYVYCTRRELR